MIFVCHFGRTFHDYSNHRKYLSEKEPSLKKSNKKTTKMTQICCIEFSFEISFSWLKKFRSTILWHRKNVLYDCQKRNRNRYFNISRFRLLWSNRMDSTVFLFGKKCLLCNWKWNARCVLQASTPTAYEVVSKQNGKQKSSTQTCTTLLHEKDWVYKLAWCNFYCQIRLLIHIIQSYKWKPKANKHHRYVFDPLGWHVCRPIYSGIEYRISKKKKKRKKNRRWINKPKQSNNINIQV